MALTLLTAGVATAQTASPKPGEGIWGLLRRNGIEPNNARAEEFMRINADLLKGKTALLQGVKYRLPGESGQAQVVKAPAGKRYPIFGAKYEWVERKSNRLAGHIYYVVPGHGGPDPGSVGRYGGKALPEDEVAYDTALRTARRLIEEGAEVYILVQDPDDGIRDTEYFRDDEDERHLDGTKVGFGNARLRKNTALINELYRKNRKRARSQQVISFHVDAYGGKVEPQIDVHFNYASDSGRELGKVLSAEMRDRYALAQPGRGYDGKVHQRENLYILTQTKPVAVLVELGNIRHPGDQQRLVKPSNRQVLADWIVEGLVRKVNGGQALASAGR